MWYPTEIALDQLKMDTKTRVVIDKRPVLLLYDSDNVYALSDKCPHLGASLALGTFENGVLTCAKHGAQIDVKTGDVVEKAKIMFLKMPTKQARTYKTKVEKGKIFVNL